MIQNLFSSSVLLLLFCLCACNSRNNDTTSQSETLTAPELKSIFINGDSIHYIDVGKGSPVVFVHGALCDYRIWRNEIDTFAKDHRVISYSRRFAWPNQQTVKDSSALSFASHVNDLAELLKALKLEPAHLVGHSSGAVIALFLGMEHPELVRSLTLGEPPVFSLLGDTSQDDASFIDPVAEAFMNNEPEKAVKLWINSFTDFSRLSPLDSEITMMNAPDLRAIVFGKFFWPNVTCKDLEKIKIPVLLLAGDKSGFEVFDALYSKMQPCLSNKEKAILPNTTHGLQMDSPSEFNILVLGFIDRH